MAAARVMHRVGVTGYPLTHTVSPAFQQPAFDHYGISAAYRTYPVTAEDLPALIATLREPEWLGLNVTIPHKEAVVALVDRCTATARTIGASTRCSRMAGASLAIILTHTVSSPRCAPTALPIPPERACSCSARAERGAPYSRRLRRPTHVTLLSPIGIAHEPKACWSRLRRR